MDLSELSRIIPNSPEHMALRCGRATASEFSAVLAKGQGKTRAAYLRRLVAERLTGKSAETYKNAHMERGIEQEPYARLAYEAITGEPITPMAFIPHRDLMAGCSPDGLIGDDGGGEFKCVIPTVQLETIATGGYPTEHKAQIQGSLWLSGRRWWDFCSHSPDFKDAHLRTYIFRVERDEPYILNLQAEVTVFLKEVDAQVAKFKEPK
jgi:hypothetical protein